MLERSPPQVAQIAGAGVFMTARRTVLAIAFAVTVAGSLGLAALALSPGGLGLVDIVLLALFALTLPWMAVGFWNALIGFLIMRFAPDPVATVLPAAAAIGDDEAVTASTAILLCVRNELPERTIRNLEPMLAGLAAAGVGDRFHIYVLSDTDDAGIAAQEAARFGALAARWRGRIAVAYRRREINTGYKAGNIRDFCERWGDRHDFAVTLDADSFMTAGAILRLVRLMQADPRLGILQGLVVGMPSTSAFARLFQFGMRLGMRSYTIGSAWWQGDCGPYWGHNAVLRLKPFIAHCELPVIDDTHILSHDQIEAVLMRRAGYDVRVVPEEELGWEENPPTLIEFIRRDLRWCQGNMQYWRFLALPGLKLVSRYQLAIAILMFLGSPAWIGLLAIGTLSLAFAATPADFIRPDAGLALFLLVLAMWFAPTIATAIDILLRSGARRAFGGGARFIANFVIAIAFSILLVPIMWLGHTLFLIGLPFGREIGWIGQARDHHAVPPGLALRNLWPHTLLGWSAIGILAMTHPAAIPYVLFLAAGPALAIPLAVVTAWPSLGLTFARIGIGRLPEESAPPAALGALGLPAIAAAAAPARPTLLGSMLDGLRTARGVVRSLRIYYGNRAQAAAMDRLYGSLMRRGDLVFDIGAHVGDRVAAFRRLGARVVAVEPQPALVKTLKLIYGRKSDVAIEAAAVGRALGTTALMINRDNPTVSTASRAFVDAARGAPGWQAQRWTKTIDVPLTTLDALIARHGTPAFIKIDVEGFEAEALAGLTHPVKALSFEFTTIQRDVALACIERCVALGYARFNAALGESQTMEHADWIDGGAIARWLAALPPAANSGDVYAALA